ncbi:MULTISPECIES: reverse transcriptase family protein [unclassified Shewanella]|uniref:reverse transcriptase family protein n=1 Tax=unclassified Shewanella TaxID=196818 RepID=UPI002006B757|nr:MULTISPECIES: reverse transcriptase family protein [unclassified Shewanella]MCK7634442.1 reverse transcriptase family protein [Shewanella sp. JNE17]MCK7649558.1 reverse transcriptase family protein [Shewanella sp. JNE8]MCK7657871.1 reverse transcriptase family protein [Shewanella sp. JNE4-2]MCU8082764.1 reverse transcriptase family protein [Shewanella sp. SM23]UPO30082.1 reverse transcriptase family protein [Shewanella sp. JNE2]
MKKFSRDFFSQKILGTQLKLFDDFERNVREHHFRKEDLFSITTNSNHFFINQKINRILLKQLPINSSACGFVENKSYLDFLEPHKFGYYFLRLDIKSFFHSIKTSEIKSLLSPFFSNTKENRKFSELEIAFLAVTHKVSANHKNTNIRDKEILPIGFPTSPAISNLIFRKVDLLIEKYCDNKNIIYTRYADDMLFSSSTNPFVHNNSFENEISILVSLLSLKLNKSKRVTSTNTISLNGYVIKNKKPRRIFLSKEISISEGKIWLSNKKLKKINKFIYEINKGTPHEIIMKDLYNISKLNFKNKFGYYNEIFFKKYIKDQITNKLNGYRSYLLSFVTYNENKHCIEKNYLEKIIKIINKIESISI